MSQAEIAQYSPSTWDEKRPVTVSLLLLRGLTVGGWVVAEGLLLMAVLALVWSQIRS